VQHVVVGEPLQLTTTPDVGVLHSLKVPEEFLLTSSLHASTMMHSHIGSSPMASYNIQSSSTLQVVKAGILRMRVMTEATGICEWKVNDIVVSRNDGRNSSGLACSATVQVHVSSSNSWCQLFPK
jgi:hypothetical protein